MKKETWITIGICCVILLTAGLIYLRSDAGGTVSGRKTAQWEASLGEDSGSTSSSEPVGEQGDASDTECTVYICGAVKHPGVYRFTGDSRVWNAVEAAGGFTRKAVADAVNQARPLVDGEQITIPRKIKSKKAAGGDVSSDHEEKGDNGLVNINEADRGELMTLSGIGEAKAQTIIDYRSENGRFSRTEDIMQIPGIKEGIYNKIKNRITV